LINVVKRRGGGERTRMFPANEILFRLMYRARLTFRSFYDCVSTVVTISSEMEDYKVLNGVRILKEAVASYIKLGITWRGRRGTTEKKDT
jgi:hypothetical protein